MKIGNSTSKNLLLFSFLLSGAAGLAYEMLWTRLLSLVFGAESLAMLGVLSGLFAGMALGSFLLARRLQGSRNPIHCFILLEICAAIYALLSPLLLYYWAPSWPGVAGNSAYLGPLAQLQAIVISGLLILPATFCMGATLPALCEAYRRAYKNQPPGYGLTMLYTCNTLGAILGVLLAVHWIMPYCGLVVGAIILALGGVLSALLAWRWSWQHELSNIPVKKRKGDSMMPASILYPLLAGTGMAGIGYELIGTRILSQISRGTVYSFAHVLVIFLIGTSLGAAVYGRFIKKDKPHHIPRVTSRLIWFCAASIPLSCSLLHQVAYGIKESSTILELLLAATLFMLPTMGMGALFCHLCGNLADSVGKAYAANTLGSALAPMLFGALLGSFTSYIVQIYTVIGLYSLLYLAASLLLYSPKKQLIYGVSGLVILTGLLPSSMSLIPPMEGWKEIAAMEGMMGRVMVTQQATTENPQRKLQVNSHFYMGGGHSFGECRMGHIPMLLAPKKERVLFLGVGTGSTMGTALTYPTASLDGVEIIPEIIDMLHYFNDINHHLSASTHACIHCADARHYLSTGSKEYDLIVADLFHPSKDGVAFLYTREHFRHVQEHLTDQGIFVQWLPLYQLEANNLKMVFRTFLDVFPETQSFIGLFNASSPALALVGSNHPGFAIDASVFAQRFQESPDVCNYIEHIYDLVAAHLMDSSGLKAYAGAGPLNTDLFPRLLFPEKETASQQQTGATNLGYLLEASPAFCLPIKGQDSLQQAAMMQTGARFQKAAQLYMRGDILCTCSDEAIPSPQAVALFLEAYKTEPEFSPARGRLLYMASQHSFYTENICQIMLQYPCKNPAIQQRCRELLERHKLRTGNRFSGIKEGFFQK